MNPADAGNDSSRRNVVIVDIQCREPTDLEELRAIVNERIDPIPGQQLAARQVPLARPRRTAGQDLLANRSQVFGQRGLSGLAYLSAAARATAVAISPQTSVSTPCNCRANPAASRPMT